MASTKQTVLMRGKVQWAKVLGKPVPNYNKDGFEWTFDLVLDAAGVKQAKQHKELNIKDKDGEKVISFKQKELRANGDPNQPIEITDIAGRPWDQDKLIGNGSVADVKFVIQDFGPGKYPGIYPRTIRVLDHVAYSGGLAPLDSDDEYFAKAQEAEKAYKMTPAEDVAFRETFGGGTEPDADDLNDDIPE